MLPPAGAAAVSVTVHVVEAPGVRLVGAHASDETAGNGVTVTVAVVLALSVAVTVAVCTVATEPEVATNEADVAPAATPTEGGTGSAALLDESATVLPPAGAG